MIAKYGISQALLAADPTTDRLADQLIDLAAPYALDKADLLHTVATALRCNTVQSRRRRDGRRRLSGDGRSAGYQAGLRTNLGTTSPVPTTGRGQLPDR